MTHIALTAGPWQQALRGVDQVDAVITDAPFGASVHSGHNVAAAQVRGVTGQEVRQAIDYDAMSPNDVFAFVGHWVLRNRGWFAVFSCDTLSRVWRAAFTAHGLYAFTPVYVRSFTPRLLGDGPSNGLVFLNVARPRTREFSTWGCLPAEYTHHKEKHMRTGGKSRSLMQQIIGDYTNPGFLVCDPFAGYGTTLLAARELSCNAVGAECDPAAYDEACARIAAPWQRTYHPRTPLVTAPAEQEGFAW